MHRPILILAVVILVACTLPVGAGGIPDTHKPVIKKGLEWLVEHQGKDGSYPFGISDPHYHTVATSFAGLALLAEGSTATKGKYAANIDRATEWLVRNCGKRDSDGLLTGDRSQGGIYMFGHAYATLFLASVCARFDVPDDGKKPTLQQRMDRVRRKELQEVLKRAVAFSVRAQISTGGWHYVSSEEAGAIPDFQNFLDESTVTLCQIQALRAARMAGVAVPEETMKKAYARLAKLTTASGGLRYASGSRGDFKSIPLTIAAIACAYDPADYNKELPKKCIKFSENSFTPDKKSRFPDYTYFHAALVLHGLGEKGFADIFGKEQPGMKWSEHRKLCFENARDTQEANGSWKPADPRADQVYATAIKLIVLQLDNEAVPIFRTKAEGKKK
ncbi:MAG: terpene cyclase/mutase family protein [Planctomycetes bacterium]|nr:terpene cyclase/mutase family protein [Planctomycetota bacterium]